MFGGAGTGAGAAMRRAAVGGGLLGGGSGPARGGHGVRRWDLEPQKKGGRSRLQGAAVLLGAGCLVLYVLLGGAGLGGVRGEGGLKRRPQGLVSGFTKPAKSIKSLDKAHIYRFKATEFEYYAKLWADQQKAAPSVLHVEGFQDYVDSSPELKKMQEDCYAPPDKEFYDQFTLTTPNTETGDRTLVRGVNPQKGMSMNDGVVNLGSQHKVALTSRIYNINKELAEAIDRPDGMNNSGNYYYPPGGFREWHTNKCQQAGDEHFKFGSIDPAFKRAPNCDVHHYSTGGWRGYMVYAEEENKSWMSVIDGSGSFRTLMDRSGYVSLFYLPGGEANSWHTIVSQTHRWSIGFRITEAFMDKWLLPALQREEVMIEDIELNLNQNWIARMKGGSG